MWSLPSTTATALTPINRRSRARLYNRPLDQLFVIDEMAALGNNDASFLYGMVDAENTGVVGYSMGGYGLVINLGGGYSDALVAHEMAPPNGLALRHAAN